jgi:hypothetical protein
LESQLPPLLLLLLLLLLIVVLLLTGVVIGLGSDVIVLLLLRRHLFSTGTTCVRLGRSEAFLLSGGRDIGVFGMGLWPLIGGR